MKDEYAKIVDEEFPSHDTNTYRAVVRVINRCEALANKPVRELTNEEIDAAYGEKVSLGALTAIRRVIAAHIAKQSEPDEIPFDQKKLDEGGWVIKLVPPGESSHTYSGQTKVTLVRKQ